MTEAIISKKQFSSLHAVHPRSAEEGTQRKTPKVDAVGLGVPTAAGWCCSPSPCPRQSQRVIVTQLTSMPPHTPSLRAGLAGTARAACRLCGKGDRRSLFLAGSCFQFMHLEAPREGLRVDLWKSLAWRIATFCFPGWKQYDFVRNQHF